MRSAPGHSWRRWTLTIVPDPATDPFAAFDAYDRRSRIENTCNREAKEHWFLESHPKRTEAGVRVQTYFVFVCMALVAGFRKYKAKADEAKRRGQETGISRYRRELYAANQDQATIALEAAVSPPAPQVVWYVDGRMLCVADYPYTARWKLAPGEHVFQVGLPYAPVRSARVRVSVAN